MATFTEANIKQIWNIFGMEREQLAAGSALRSACTDLQQWDIDNGQDLVTDVQTLLAEITALDSAIAAAQGSAGYGSVAIDKEVTVSYKAGGSALSADISNREGKVAQIRNILQLDRYAGTVTGLYTRVLGISAGEAYTYSRESKNVARSNLA